MRIFSVIFLIMILVAVDTAYGHGGFFPNINITPLLFPTSFPSKPPQTPNGFWFKPDADREQLKQDYSECRGKGERSCMREKGYTWLTPGTSFWYKIGTTQRTSFWYKIGTAQQQIVQDYSECRGKGERPCMREKGYTWLAPEQIVQDYSECRGKGERSCMREKGYTWASYYGE